MLMKVEWGEVAQWSKFWMSSDSGISRSICPIIGGPEHRNILPLDRNQLTVERSGCSYYLQENQCRWRDIHGLTGVMDFLIANTAPC